ncbi:MAG: tetratricopeptide repeat protein [Candidatus Sumerlaeaceae bacterium]|nr:tetratricopeptide repeat protein [Candidatus Sumerlaeaceae bacterium]
MARMTRHELKHDEMRDLGEHLLDWIRKHANTLTTVVLIVALGFLGWKLYGKYVESRQAAAGAELGTLLRHYYQGIGAPTKDKRTEMLATTVNDAERIAREHAKTYAGRLALLILGNAKYYEGMFAETAGEEAVNALREARGAFERFIRVAASPEEKAAGHLALGQTLENLLFITKDLALAVEAQDAYKEVVKLVPNSYLAAEAKLGMARLLQNQQGRQEEARKLYEEIIASRPVPEVKPPEGARPVRMADGRELTVDDLTALRSFSKYSIQEQAKDMLRAMQGLAPAEPTS